MLKISAKQLFQAGIAGVIACGLLLGPPAAPQ